MEKNKEDGMTDLEIIKKNFNIITESEGYDYWYELEKEALDAATRMAAEIERLKAEIAEKPDIVRCGECKKRETENCPRYHYDEVYMTHFWPDDKSYCEKGTHKEAKNED